MEGRPGIPSAIKLLTGSHPERINKLEAKFRKVEDVRVLKIVERDPLALEEWNRVLPELVESGLLTRANLAVFGSYRGASFRAESPVSWGP
jgi:phage terminase small subunit